MQVTATMPWSFLTQTAALWGFPARGRGGSSWISSRTLAKSASGLYWPLAKKASQSTLSGSVSSVNSPEMTMTGMDGKRPDHGQQLKPAHVRHAEIGDDHVRQRALESKQCLKSIGSGMDLIPTGFKQPFAGLAHGRVVFDDQDAVRKRGIGQILGSRKGTAMVSERTQVLITAQPTTQTTAECDWVPLSRRTESQFSRSGYASTAAFGRARTTRPSP